MKTNVRPTIKTLAEYTGYSIATISKALRGSPVVTEETRKIILSAADELGYQANARGMALRTGKTYQAAVLMPMNSVAGYEWDGVEYTQILSGVNGGVKTGHGAEQKSATLARA
ncbi:LacI family DNA-binding transcriptional regulator [Brucella oryzae]|uniref:LacI family DNA-binding transcriptional regulator n=1 Tax=Brucella oryzae TaxID=335286 RepID=UPI002013C058|nr:LacI family DNA-binding transcriptional regulator [Brucella oryzae]